MTAFGLDISDTLVRLAVLEKRGAQFFLPVRAEITIPPEVIVDGEIRQPTVAAHLLAQLVKASRARTKRAIVSLPERQTFLKLISLPADRGVTEASVQAEASQHIPFAPGEMYFDWYLLPQKNSLGERQVVIGAAAKTLVDAYLSVLHDAGIETMSIEPESLSLVRAIWQKGQQSDAAIVLDLGRTRSTIILVRDEIVRFSVTVRYAGKDLNRFIADELKISDDQAEKAKKIFGLDPRLGRGVLYKVLSPQMDILAEKIRDVESFYVEHFIDHRPIKEVTLTGSGAMLKGIDQQLSQRLNQTVVIHPSWVYQQLRAHDPSLPIDVGLGYTTAFGLALKNFSP
ncbi:MAG: type IV pilus assembly protein PilM [Candidatus Kerfeldbacteria bacterium]|nr:type IV pilus assembly protein PilM [Candidatus Kerfeldbacteria bacterium]